MESVSIDLQQLRIAAARKRMTSTTHQALERVLRYTDCAQPVVLRVWIFWIKI